MLRCFSIIFWKWLLHCEGDLEVRYYAKVLKILQVLDRVNGTFSCAWSWKSLGNSVQIGRIANFPIRTTSPNFLHVRVWFRKILDYLGVGGRFWRVGGTGLVGWCGCGLDIWLAFGIIINNDLGFVMSYQLLGEKDHFISLLFGPWGGMEVDWEWRAVLVFLLREDSIFHLWLWLVLLGVGGLLVYVSS